MQQLEQQLKRNISKARIYFQQKALCQGQLEAIKSQVESLQASVSRSKYEYAQSLRQLEAISEEIHFQRNRLTVKVSLYIKSSISVRRFLFTLAWGQTNTLDILLRKLTLEDGMGFRNILRMAPADFKTLLQIVGANISKDI